MKTLEEGKNQKWHFDTRCRGNGNNHELNACGAFLSIEQKDIFVVYVRGDGLKESDYTYAFECHDCKSWTIILRRFLPYTVTEYAKRKLKRQESAKRAGTNVKKAAPIEKKVVPTVTNAENPAKKPAPKQTKGSTKRNPTTVKRKPTIAKRKPTIIGTVTQLLEKWKLW